MDEGEPDEQGKFVRSPDVPFEVGEDAIEVHRPWRDEPGRLDSPATVTDEVLDSPELARLPIAPSHSRHQDTMDFPDQAE